VTPQRLDDLLARLRKVRVAVCGDFFLDKYLHIDPALAETSLETGLEAHQVVEVRCQAGAAGTVCNNLTALGVRHVEAVGYRGADGDGFELRRALRRAGVSTPLLLDAADRVTPTYTKPLVMDPDAAPRELNRLDIKNHSVTPRELEQRIIEAIEIAATRAEALIIADQVEEPDCGVITARVRDFLAKLGQVAPDLVILADSRRNVARFRHVSVKPNAEEARRGFDLLVDSELLASHVSARVQRPVFITRGADGVVVADGSRTASVPGVKAPGPLDIVGAGDSFCAGSVAALAAGATWEEAAQLGCLVASITVQQLGTTGTASPAQIRSRLLASPYVSASA
jgi:rfaE bifunctional protein kinase chain/domain